MSQVQLLNLRLELHSRAFLNRTVPPTTKRRAAARSEAVTIGTVLYANLLRNRNRSKVSSWRASGTATLPVTAPHSGSSSECLPRGSPTAPNPRHTCPLAAALSKAFRPRSCFTPTRRIPAASTCRSGSLPRFLGPASFPELIPATARPGPPPGIQVPPRVHPPPFSPPSPPANRPGPTPVEAEEGGTRREGGEGGYGRPAPHSAPPSRSVPERGLSSTSPAPPLRFRPARP